ncbi:MAG TPA: RCC1 domain-containing protein, partial [Longimicrobium sp.]
VTGRANGGSWIVGTAGTRADSARVTVTQQAVRLDLTPRADTLNALGDTIAFTARALDRNDQPVSGVALTWTASNPLRMIRPGVFVSRTNGLATVTVSGGGFTQTATVLNRQVPATITLRSGTLIVNDTVPLNPARARQLAIVEEVADSNAVRVDVSARPAATITPAGAIAAGSQAVIAAAPGGGTATVQIGAATGTAQFDVVAFDSVAAGDDHGCGLTTGGDVYCWGAGFNQPLPSPAGRPRKVNLPGRATAITSDCALLQNGTVYCGLAGTPAPWTGVPAMASLTEGCALTASGTAYCQDADRVVRPLAGYTFVQVSQRSEAPNGPPLERCGLQANGQVVCWTPGGTPAPLAGGHTFRRIDLGRWMSCGITTDGRLLCWGYLYGDGAPVLVSASLGLVTLEVEYANACGLRADGALFCWGSDGVIEWDPGVAVAPAPKWPTLRFTDYSVGLVGFTSTTGMAALECGVADGTLWCSGGDLRSNVGRTGGPGLAGRVMSPF